MSDSLWHGLQHARPPCPSPIPRVYSNSCPLSQWCHPTNDLILCHPLLLPTSIFSSIGQVFSLGILNSSCFYCSFHSLHNSISFMQLLCLWQPVVSTVMLLCVPSHFSCDQLSATLWTVARQASLSMKFYKQEYWRGLPCPSSGDLPHPGIEPASPVATALQADSSPLSHQGSPHSYAY